MSIPIIDSHIHLFPASHLPTLSWYGPDSPLGSQHCVDEYRLATSSAPVSPDSSNSPANPVYLRGYVFVETDRVSSVEERINPADGGGSGDGDGDGWKHVLDEVALLAKIIRGEAVDGDRYRHTDRPDCLGIVSWAPVPGGVEVLKRYMQRVKEVTGTDGDASKKVCGVRYLIQDKPAGVMLKSAFIDGLKWLGREGLTFDLGVDARQGGLGQLREAVEMMKQIYEDVDEKEQVVIIINHLCKPNLRLPYITPESITIHADFQEWKTLITTMAKHPKTYMKLSGAFSELPPLPPAPEPDIFSLVERLHPWTDAVFDAFGPERVMFGSDWPVCNLGGGGNDVAWKRWMDVVEGVLERQGLSEKQKRDVWGAVAMRAYRIDAENV